MRVIRYVCLSLCWFAGVQAYGQLYTHKVNAAEFRGHVEGGFGSYDGLVVEVTNLLDRTIRERADVASDGTFGFRSIPEGDYEVRVTTLYGSELTSTVTSVGPSNTQFEIRLQQATLQKPISGTVSIQQLNHPLSRQVRKLLEGGQRMLEEKHYDEAVARFREAVRNDPKCPQARASLALALTKTEDWNTAVEEYRAAIALDPGNSILHSNLSVALVVQNRYGEAGSEASTAIKLDSRNARAHYIIASVLLRTGGSVSETVSHLVAAQEVFPAARDALHKICAANHVESCP